MKQRYLLGIILIFVSFFANSQDHQDMQSALNVCESKSYRFETMRGTGEVAEKVDQKSCFGSAFNETNSKWLKWSPETKGHFILSIVPLQEGDDLDFIIFKVDSSGDLLPVRCMASGQSLSRESNPICTGPTGLAYSSTDTEESKGCQDQDDSFLKYLEMEKGDQFYMLVNNYNSAEGFTVSVETDAILKDDGCEYSLGSQSLQLEKIYPSPAEDNISVELLNEMTGNIEFVVLDIFGQKLLSFNKTPSSSRTHESINIQSFVSGEYILLANQNGKSSTKRFIKI